MHKTVRNTTVRHIQNIHPHKAMGKAISDPAHTMGQIVGGHRLR